MLILALDTAIKSVSIALCENGKVIASERQEMDRGQGEALIPMIEQLMTKAKRTMDQLNAVAVSVGPGSFTGVRVGLAAARGMGLALHIPVYGMTTLSALAYGIKGDVLAVIDTKRGDFYTQLFRDGQALTPPCICSLDEIKKRKKIKIATDDDSLSNMGDSVICHKRTMAEVIGLGAKAGPLPPEPVYLREADVSFPKSR